MHETVRPVENNGALHARTAKWKANRDAAVAEKRAEREKQAAAAELRLQRRRAGHISSARHTELLRRGHAWNTARKRSDELHVDTVPSESGNHADPSVPVVDLNLRRQFTGRVSDTELLSYLDSIEAGM